MSEGIYSKHLIMELAGFDEVDIFLNDHIKSILIKAVQNSGANILNVYDHHFEPYGYTCVVLIAESHASVHTYPEYDGMFVDFFTCGDVDLNQFIQTMIIELNPKHVKYSVIEREI